MEIIKDTTIKTLATPSDLSLYFPIQTYRRLLAYTRAVNTEISGLAEVEWDEDKLQFTAGQVYLLEQEAGGADVELGEESLSRFLMEYIKKGKKQLPRLWWHSHNDFQTFFSSTDQGTIEKLHNDSFIIAVCINKEGALHASATLFKPVKLSIEPLITTIGQSKVIASNSIEAEVKEKVKSRWGGFGWNRFGKQTSVFRENNYTGKHPSSLSRLEMLPKNEYKQDRFVQDHKLTWVFDPISARYIFYNPRKDIIYLDPFFDKDDPYYRDEEY